MTNLTLQDAAGSLRAGVALTAILFSPGYVLGFALNLFRFRVQSLRERVAWSVALSFACVPIFTALAGRWMGIHGVVGVLVLSAAASVVLLVYQRQGLRISSDKYLWMLAIFLLLASALVICELIDVQVGHKLYLSVTVMDQAYRVGFTNAIARRGIPPLNPFYHPGGDAPLRYYYFWYAVCAVCMKLAHVSARQALMASSVWCGLGLTAIVALFVRHFLAARRQVERHILTAVLLFTVTGADLIPVFYNIFRKRDFGGETEWWSADQISSWMDTILWVPNHTASLIVCLVAFLLFWRLRENLSVHERRVAVLLAGVAGASAFGLSIYVTAGFILMMIAWCLRLLVQDRRSTVPRGVAASSMCAAVLSAPYLHDLLGASSGTEARGVAGPAHMFQLSVRRMIDPACIADLSRLAAIKIRHPMMLDQVSRLLLLLPGYSLELGFFCAILVYAWLDRERLDEARRTALFLALTGLAIVSFVRSSVIGNNDFGYRAVLLPCFFLLLLGAETLLEMQDGRVPVRKVRGAVLTILLLLGFCGTVFQAQALRSYVPLHAAHGAAGFENLGERVYELRVAYAALESSVPLDAIVQFNPSDQTNYLSFANVLFAERSMITDAAPDCGAVFGGDPTRCQAIQRSIQALFNSSGATAIDARGVCERTGARYLAVAQWDRAWQQRDGWAWTLPVIVEHDRVRIVDCSNGPAKVRRDASE